MTSGPHNLTRYSASLAVVLGVHAVAIFLALHWPRSEAIELPPQPMMVELAPLAEPAAQPETPKVEAAPPPPAPIEEPPLPKLTEAPKPEIAVPVEKPKPKPKPKSPKPVPVKQPEPPQEKAPAPKPQEATPPTQAAPEKTVAPAAAPAAPPSSAVVTWQGELSTFINKRLRYPDSATRGGVGSNTNIVHFTLDADGNLLECTLVTSSGKEVLDRASLDMMRKAKSFPKPPPELLKNGIIKLTIPLNYDLIPARR